MTSINIRPAQPEDVPAILDFIKGLAEYEKLAHEVIATENKLKETLFCENAKAEVIIGLIDDKPAGFALFFHSYSTFLAQPGIYLEDLFVKPEFRGRNLGRKLLIHLGQIAVERDCGRLEWSVLDWNTPAIEFYKKMGAIPMEGWTTNRVTGEALTHLSNMS